MVWAKVDDQYPRNRKVLAAGAEGMALDIAGMCWSNAEGTDGHIPDYVVAALYPMRSPRKTAAKLVEVGRWHAPDHDCPDCPAVDGGWYIHDFLKYNPTADRAAAKSEARSKAGRRGGKESGKARSKQASKREANSEANASANGKQAGQQNRSNERTPSPYPLASNEARSPTGDDVTAQTLIGEYVSACKATPPKQHIGHLAKNVKALLDEGYEPTQLRPALERVRAKGLNPATLPSVLNEVLNAANGHGPQPGGKVVIG